jgi:hypothetical protein
MPRAVWLAAICLASCAGQSDLETFKGRALREIDQCLAHGRDCGTRGPYFPNYTERTRLRSLCREVGRVSPPEDAGGFYRLILTCQVDGMNATYTATADRGLPDELREPVVSYDIRR